MKIDLEKDNLEAGLLGLVVALGEILQEVLEHQALRRMEQNSLSEPDIERLGRALLRLRKAIQEFKTERGIEAAVGDIRRQFDGLVDGRWLSRGDP